MHQVVVTDIATTDGVAASGDGTGADILAGKSAGGDAAQRDVVASEFGDGGAAA